MQCYDLRLLLNNKGGKNCESIVVLLRKKKNVNVNAPNSDIYF